MKLMELARLSQQYAEEHKDSTLELAFRDGFRQGYQHAKDTRQAEDTEPVEVTEDDFELFWRLYDYKKAKPNAKKMWARLNKKQRAEVMQNVAEYVRSTPEKRYRMHPATYLNPANERWKDEITEMYGQELNAEANYERETIELLARLSRGSD